MTEAVETPVLLFKSPVFHNGLNLTVRAGRKWFDRLKPGDKVVLRDTYAEPSVLGEDGDDDENPTYEEAYNQKIVTADVIAVFAGSIDDTPENLLQFEHSPGCRNLAGLKAEMASAYSEFGGYDPNDVTAIFFYVPDDADLGRFDENYYPGEENPLRATGLED